jgi:hypothetical protein
MANDLQEALTAAGAAALVQKQIDPVLLEYQRRYAPLVRSLPSVKWGSTVYYFNKRTSLPSGGFVTDGGARTVSTSNYAQENFQIRLLQSVGAVTGYSQAVTQDLIGDLRAREIEGAARGLYWDIENALIWGNEAATKNGAYPQFDGLDTIVASFTSGSALPAWQSGGAIDNYGGAQGANGWGTELSSAGVPNAYTPWTDGVDQNAIDAAGATLSLAYLDQLIDMVESNVAEPIDNSEWNFVMSPTANSKLAQLLTNQQRFVDQVEVAAGLIVPTYRGVPIIKSSFLSPRSNVMGAVTAATTTTGGSIGASTTYHYRVSAVIARFGEIQASATVSQASGSGTSTNTVVLSFSVPTGPDGAQPTHYKVYRGTSSSNHTLLGCVDASLVDSSGSLYNTIKITDTGGALVPGNGANVPAIAPSAYYYTNTGLKPLDAGSQSIFLMSRDPNYIVRPYVREMQPINVYPTTASPDSLPFAFVADTTLAVRGPKFLGRLANIVAAL